MTFCNKSKSLLPMNKDTIALVWDMSIKASMKTAERNGVVFIEPNKPKLGVPIGSANFQAYMMAITGQTGCVICNGPRGYWFHPPSITCLFFPVHSIITGSKSNIADWEIRLGPICTHGYYRAECKECIAEAIASAMESTNKQVAYVQ